jgi:hypothetical protein
VVSGRPSESVTTRGQLSQLSMEMEALGADAGAVDEEDFVEAPAPHGRKYAVYEDVVVVFVFTVLLLLCLIE